MFYSTLKILAPKIVTIVVLIWNNALMHPEAVDAKANFVDLCVDLSLHCLLKPVCHSTLC